MMSASKWNSKWEKVSIPHTWNNKDMQRGYNRFYEGEAYYQKIRLPYLF